MNDENELIFTSEESETLFQTSDSETFEYDFSYIENDVHSINETLVSISDNYNDIVHYSHMSYIFIVAIWVLVFISAIRGFIWH